MATVSLLTLETLTKNTLDVWNNLHKIFTRLAQNDGIGKKKVICGMCWPLHISPWAGFLCLPFGIKSASEVFQQMNIPGTYAVPEGIITGA